MLKVIDRNKATGDEVCKLPNGTYVTRHVEGKVISSLLAGREPFQTLTEARLSIDLGAPPAGSKETLPKKAYPQFTGTSRTLGKPSR